MTPFTFLDALAAPLPLANVDTDKILAARFLKTISREGLGRALFDTLRRDPDGSERESFVLNRPPWTEAGILIALDNFGYGSSREHAPWALLDFGFRCIIAPSFADIFYNNCFKNGILPIVLPLDQVEALIALAGNAETARMQIDLPAQEIRAGTLCLNFAIDPRRKQDLLDGADEIARSLTYQDQIARFEAAARARRPWVPEVPMQFEPSPG